MNPAVQAGDKSFKAALKTAAKDEASSTSSSDSSTDATDATDSPAESTDATSGSGKTKPQRTTPPEGEKWRPVKGHDDYAEIVAGPRKGQYVNLERGSRRFQSFTIEQRDGKTYHVYGDGQDKVEVEVDDSKEAKKAGTPRVTPPAGEKWAPVPGHRNYADILNGKRNGYYVNIQQGSSREGQVFTIVKRGGREFHVYGEGKDRVEVEVGANKRKSDDSKSPSGDGGKKTGAASAA